MNAVHAKRNARRKSHTIEKAKLIFVPDGAKVSLIQKYHSPNTQTIEVYEKRESLNGFTRHDTANRIPNASRTSKLDVMRENEMLKVPTHWKSGKRSREPFATDVCTAASAENLPKTILSRSHWAAQITL